MKRKIHIDWEEVSLAFEMHFDEVYPMLDLDTGKVRHHYGEFGHGGEDDPTRIEEDEIDRAPESYASIERPESHEAFRWMEGFAASQTDEQVREKLLDALDRRRPFRRFKDALGDFPDLYEDWYAFEAERLYEHIARWAQSLPVEILNPPAWLIDDTEEEEAGADVLEFPASPSGRKLTWRDVCPTCRKYKESERPPNDHPLTADMGLTEGDLCQINRADQEDAQENFQCGAFEPGEKH